MIEPSLILNTGQIALNIIAQEMSVNGNKPVYCICDRVVSGLIDTLSHILHSEFTDVVSAPVPRCGYTGMAWDVDGDFKRQQLFDKETQYLGNGVEIASVAIKNQIPKVSWYGETKIPIRDIRRIAEQNYTTICKYIKQPIHQKTITEKIDFVPNLWDNESKKENFIIVEDEFCNMFVALRAYLSRGTKQSFVNVLSENYLLRDYMRCNKQMFFANSNAIPSIVPNYAKTERNTFIKLLMLMTVRPVCEDEVISEFRLACIECDDSVGLLNELLKKYTSVSSSIFNIKNIRSVVGDSVVKSTFEYTILKETFEYEFSDSLNNAYFIIEDEKIEKEYIDAKLFGHITQVVLPGQYTVYDGKYYFVKHISPVSGVVLRRAGDLFEKRLYYRQVRKYSFAESNEILISTKKIIDIEVKTILKNISVETTGYLEMDDIHNLRTAKLIDFSSDPLLDNYRRSYRNKQVLQIKLPDSNEKVLFTLCLLISEIFRTIFPDGWPYLAVVTKIPDNIDGVLNYMLYSIHGDIEEGCIYIIEDSDIDLGLLEAIEMNLTKILEIVTDFIDWHIQKMQEPATEDPQPKPITVLKREEAKKRSLLEKMFLRIKKIFSGNSTPEADTPTTTNEVGEETKTAPEKVDTNTPAEEKPEYSLDNDTEEAQPLVNDTTEDEPSNSEGSNNDGDDFSIINVDGTDIFENDGLPEHNEYFEDNFKLMGLSPINKSRYQAECFLKFGFEEIDQRLQLDDLFKYLRVHGWSNNDLTKSRKREPIIKEELQLKAVNRCDFCGTPINGVSYDVLNDGRTRCMDCSNSAIITLEEFKELYIEVLSTMEPLFGIKIKVPLSVGTTNAKTIAKRSNSVFEPSTEFSSRVLGFAQKKVTNINC